MLTYNPFPNYYNPFTDYYETGKLYVVSGASYGPGEAGDNLRYPPGIIVDIVNEDHQDILAVRVMPGEIVLWLGPAGAKCIHSSFAPEVARLCECAHRVGNFWCILWSGQVCWIADGERGCSTSRKFIDEFLVKADPRSIAAAREGSVF